MTGFPNLVSEKESGFMDYKVQARENDRQRRNEKVWDMFLSDYGKRLIVLTECVGRLLLCGMAIKGDFKKVEAVLNSRYGFFKLLNRTQDNNTFEASNIIQIIVRIQGVWRQHITPWNCTKFNSLVTS